MATVRSHWIMEKKNEKVLQETATKEGEQSRTTKRGTAGRLYDGRERLTVVDELHSYQMVPTLRDSEWPGAFLVPTSKLMLLTPESLSSVFQHLGRNNQRFLGVLVFPHQRACLAFTLPSCFIAANHFPV